MSSQRGKWSRPPLAVRFWSRVAKGPGCWEWQGGKVRGYGEIWTGKRSRTHRLSYEMHFGPIPAGMFVCHRCDNPSCVRPDHLFLGTPRDNTHDAMRKGRLARGDRHPSRLRPETRARGEGIACAKLTERDVRRAREMRAEGTTISALARHYGVTRTAVRNAINQKTWKHVA